MNRFHSVPFSGSIFQLLTRAEEERSYEFQSAGICSSQLFFLYYHSWQFVIASIIFFFLFPVVIGVGLQDKNSSRDLFKGPPVVIIDEYETWHRGLCDNSIIFISGFIARIIIRSGRPVKGAIQVNPFFNYKTRKYNKRSVFASFRTHTYTYIYIRIRTASNIMYTCIPRRETCDIKSYYAHTIYIHVPR